LQTKHFLKIFYKNLEVSDESWRISPKSFGCFYP